MGYLVQHNEDGQITGFFPEEKEKEIDGAKIKITDQEWEKACLKPHEFRVVKGKMVAYTAPPPSLGDLKAQAIEGVNARRDEAIESRINRWSKTEQKSWGRKSALLDAFDAGDANAGKTLAAYMPSLAADQVKAAGGDPAQVMADRVRGFRDALEALDQKSESAAGDAKIMINSANSAAELETIMAQVAQAADALEADYDDQYQILKGAKS